MPLVDELDFEELALNMKVSMLNCQTKKLTDAPFQGFVHMKLKHQPPAKYRKEKKVTNLLCVGTVWCMWMKTINSWNDLWICEVLHVHSSRPVTSLTVRIEGSLFINQSKMLSYAVPSTSPTEYHGT